MTGQDADADIVDRFVSGVFTVTGRDVTVNIAMNITADSGSYSLYGRDITLFAGRPINTESGSFVLTGRDLTLQLDRRVIADQGVFVLTGGDIIVRGWLEPVVGAAAWFEQAVLTETWTDAA